MSALLALLVQAGSGQSLIRGDSAVILSLPQLAGTRESLVRFVWSQEFDYALTLSNQLVYNRPGQEKGGYLLLLQGLKYRSAVESANRFRFVNSFTHDAGFQWFFDSITRFSPDQNTLLSFFDFRLKKHLNGNINSEITTRLFHGYSAVPGPAGETIRVRSTSFLSPVTWTLSGGIGYSLPNVARFSLGIASFRLTFLHDTTVFQRLGVSSWMGVTRGTHHTLEYGLSMMCQIDRLLWKKIQWNLDLKMFMAYAQPAEYALKNMVGVKLTRYLKAAMITRLCYGEKESRRLQTENLISIGFGINHQPVN